MSKYGEAAVLAVQLLDEGKATDPRDAWIKATKKVFPASRAMQTKACPKGAFLGLCNEGMVQGIPPGSYSSQTKNGTYAIDAIGILKTNRFLVSQPDMLWKKVAGNTRSENHQMDVVVGLWKARRIST